MEKQKNEKELYEKYTSRVFVKIPKNTALITVNKLDGKRVDSFNEGFKFLIPFLYESKLVSLAIRNFDYQKQLFEDSYGQDIIVDIAVTVKIIDPIKYEFENTNVEGELKQLLDSLMRTLIKKQSYDVLSASRFSLPETYGDVDDKITNSILREDLRNARKELDDFAEQYGLAVVHLYNKNIQQTRSVQEAYDKKIIAAREKEAAQINNETKLAQAINEAEIIKAKAAAEAEAEKLKLTSKYAAIMEVIKDLPSEKQAEVLKAFAISNKGNANIFYGMEEGSSMKTGTVTGAATSSQLKEGKTK